MATTMPPVEPTVALAAPNGCDPIPTPYPPADRGSDGDSLEDVLQQFATALEHEREGLWEASWAVARAVEAVPRSSGEARRLLYGSFAAVGACTAARVAQLARVGAAFPTPENVRWEKSHTWHRAVAQRAHALGMAVEVLADLAVREGWGQRELAAYGRPASSERMPVGFRGQCGRCGAVVRVRILAGQEWQGQAVWCPVCLEVDEPPIIGRLERE